MEAVVQCQSILDKTGIGTMDSHFQRCDKMADEVSWVDRRGR